MGKIKSIIKYIVVITIGVLGMMVILPNVLSLMYAPLESLGGIVFGMVFVGLAYWLLKRSK